MCYHDGEWGEVHRRSEDDAEDADDHGALLVGVRGHEHRAHDDDHEHGLHGEDGKHPQLQTQTSGTISQLKLTISTKNTDRSRRG
jgi:hypothetical protein